MRERGFTRGRRGPGAQSQWLELSELRNNNNVDESHGNLSEDAIAQSIEQPNHIPNVSFPQPIEQHPKLPHPELPRPIDQQNNAPRFELPQLPDLQPDPYSPYTIEQIEL
ncbi:hypothetical protein PG999_008492 [Apiospora kogelbergensis]|uniref:Uncharacterized protein n=1 Tax=Apiospora kogelbergensis TaxID=1337665 RepID=A0AAW0QKN2_9PEZI